MSRTIAQRWERAQGYLARREPGPARAQLEAMRAQDPADARTHLLASEVAWRDDRIREAAHEALAALAVVPDDSPLLCAAIEVLLQAGEIVAARACLARPALAQTTTPATLLRMADFTQHLNENSESLALLERAIAAGAGDPDTAFHRGAQLYFHGRMAEAEAALTRCLDAMPEHGAAAFTLSQLRTQTPDRNHLERLALGLAKVARDTLAHAALEYARYKEYEDLGRTADAWRSLAAANAVMFQRRRFDADAAAAFMDRLIATCTAARLQPAPYDVDGPQPIFVLGFPRSGTTLLDRMLGSHPDVRSAGETTDFGAQLEQAADTRHTHGDAYLDRIPQIDFADLGRRYLAQSQWRARGRRYYIDKQPPNWEAAGLIHAALPGAKVLHLVRDPMDVCFSNWRAFFGEGYAYSNDMAALGTWHRAYQRVMAHWHAILPGAILDVPYADLTRDPEATMRRVLDHCGLPWHPACLGTGANAAPVMTLSAGDIRGPIRARSALWRAYARELAPLQASLGRGDRK